MMAMGTTMHIPFPPSYNTFSHSTRAVAKSDCSCQRRRAAPNVVGVFQLKSLRSMHSSAAANGLDIHRHTSRDITRLCRTVYIGSLLCKPPRNNNAPGTFYFTRIQVVRFCVYCQAAIEWHRCTYICTSVHDM